MKRRKKWSLERRAAASAAAKKRWAITKELEAEDVYVGKRAALSDLIYRGDKKEMPNEEKVEEPNESVEGETDMRMAGVRRMKVERVCINPRLVEGKLVGGDEDGELESIDVGRNGTLAIGDELLVRRHPEVLQLWEFVGMADQGLAVDMLG